MSFSCFSMVRISHQLIEEGMEIWLRWMGVGRALVEDVLGGDFPFPFPFPCGGLDLSMSMSTESEGGRKSVGKVDGYRRKEKEGRKEKITLILSLNHDFEKRTLLN